MNLNDHLKFIVGGDYLLSKYIFYPYHRMKVFLPKLDKQIYLIALIPHCTLSWALLKRQLIWV